MNTDCIFYLCPTCFRTSEKAETCHGHVMICYRGCTLGDESLKPVLTRNGRLRSAAPRWYLDAIRDLKHATPLPQNR